MVVVMTIITLFRIQMAMLEDSVGFHFRKLKTRPYVRRAINDKEEEAGAKQKT
jgi:hypothetical protein